MVKYAWENLTALTRSDFEHCLCHLCVCDISTHRAWQLACNQTMFTPNSSEIGMASQVGTNIVVLDQIWESSMRQVLGPRLNLIMSRSRHAWTARQRSLALITCIKACMYPRWKGDHHDHDSHILLCCHMSGLGCWQRHFVLYTSGHSPDKGYDSLLGNNTSPINPNISSYREVSKRSTRPWHSVSLEGLMRRLVRDQCLPEQQVQYYRASILLASQQIFF